MTTVTTAETEALLAEGALYIDVRSEEEFADGHVPGALNVPFQHASPSGMVENPDFADVMQRSFALDQKLVIGCRSGARSARACTLLESLGFTNLSDMTAGFEGKRDPFGRAVPGWRTEEREVETQVSVDQSYATLRAAGSSTRG